jgi:8-oxo-dGTP pyrophosphatase MutT (NUDIX family)
MSGEIKEAAVGIIIEPRHHRVCLAWNKRSRGWSLPGGRREPTDLTIGLALKRELLEEVGCEVSSVVLLGEWPGTVDPEMLVSVYHVRVAIGAPRETEPGTAVRWALWSELARDNVFGGFYARHFPEGVGHLEPTRIV